MQMQHMIMSKADYDKAKNSLEGDKTDLKSKRRFKNKGVNGLDSTKVALNDLNGQFQAGIGI